MTAATGRPTHATVPADLDAYDAGLLSDYGGGNVDWWQDYIRAELGRAHDHYAAQFEDQSATIARLERRVAVLEQEQGALKGLAVAGAQSAANSEARARTAEAKAAQLRAALNTIRHTWGGHAEQCRGNKDGYHRCDCDWPMIAAKCDAALADTEEQK